MNLGVFGFPEGNGQLTPTIAPNIQQFAASGTFQVPNGVTRIAYYVWGAGGGNGSPTVNSIGGGGGGAFAMGTLVVAPGDILTITVGTGGNGVNAGFGSPGGTGGTSSIVYGATTISCTGGAGGNDATGGAGGTATGGDLNISGGVGSLVDKTSQNWPAFGGAAPLIGIMSQSGLQCVSRNPVIPGGGSAVVSTAGADGRVLIYY